MAVAIRAGLTVHDLTHLELSYAPPFGSAKDPVNYAGFVASNVINGDMPVCHTEDVINTNGDQILLDVRTPAEFQAGTIPNAINIPLDELRSRLDELDTNKEILILCQVGLRGYLATRILKQNNFKCKNLTGGYKTYKAFTADHTNKEPSKMTSNIQSDAGICGMIANGKPQVAYTIDATCIQCPGPIMRLKESLDTINDGQAIAIFSKDPGFAADIAGWCDSTGNTFVGIETENNCHKATVIKGSPKQTDDAAQIESRRRN